MRVFTKKQRSLIDLLEREKLSLRTASHRLNIDYSAVKKMFARIEKKREAGRGSFSNENGTVEGSIGGCHFCRLHSVQFHITLSYAGERYHRRRVKSSSFKFEALTVVLYPKYLEVYINRDFVAETPDLCRAAMFAWLWEVSERLERALDVVYMKDKGANVKLVNSHVAELNNGVAYDVKEKKEALRLKGGDGKPWLEVDRSLSGFELEAVHPNAAHEDMVKLKPHLEEWRRQDKPVLTEDILSLIRSLAVLNMETAAELKAVTMALKALVPAHAGGMQESKEPGERPDYLG